MRLRRADTEPSSGLFSSVTRFSDGVPLNPDAHQGVTISPCLESCAAAARQQGHRYLADEVPKLPLPGCDARECGCRYRRHKDRRKDDDRRYEFSHFNGINPRSDKQERRSADDNDRRNDTLPAELPEPSAYFNNH